MNRIYHVIKMLQAPIGQWWRILFIPAHGRQKQLDFWVHSQSGLHSEFQDSEGNTEKPSGKIEQKSRTGKMIEQVPYNPDDLFGLYNPQKS